MRNILKALGGLFQHLLVNRCLFPSDSNRFSSFSWLTQFIHYYYYYLFIYLFIYLFYHKIQVMLKKQGSHTKANKSGEEAQKETMGLTLYRYWAP